MKAGNTIHIYCDKLKINEKLENDIYNRQFWKAFEVEINF